MFGGAGAAGIGFVISVMAGLVPGIHVLNLTQEDVDGPDMSGHDD
jgi:TctA family transporter